MLHTERARPRRGRVRGRRRPGRGAGSRTILLAHLAELRRSARHRHASPPSVHPSNHRMLQVFRDSGFPVEVRAEPGELRVELPAAARRRGAARRFEDRERIAAVGRRRPRAAPDVGRAHRRVAPAGHASAPRSLRNLLAGGFAGALYPSTPAPRTIAGLPAYRVARRRARTGRARRRRGSRRSGARRRARLRGEGVRALVVLSAGFGETGAEGREPRRNCWASAAPPACGWSGPNCLGVLEHRPAVGSTRPSRPAAAAAGRLAFASQSGGVRHRGDRRGRAARPRASPRSSRSATRPTCRATTSCRSGSTTRHRRDAALPRVVRQPAPVRPDRARASRASKPVSPSRAGARQPGRARRRRTPARSLAASDATVDALFEPCGRHPHRHPGRAVRRRRSARRPAPAARRSGRDRHQRGRPGHRLRRRLRRGGPARRAAR